VERSAHNGPKKPRGTAKDRALLLLGVRWRSRDELRRRLRAAGFEPDEVEGALADLEGAELIEDGRFAREMVRDQAGRRLAGNRSIRAGLLQKGVAREIVDEALQDAGEESERALELARHRAARLSGLPPGAAYRRLFGLLVRRGYGPGVAREACTVALRDLVDEGSLQDEGS
jgi:regulatory protein